MLRPLTATAVAAIVRAQLDEHAEEPFCAACSELTGVTGMKGMGSALPRRRARSLSLSA